MSSYCCYNEHTAADTLNQCVPSVSMVCIVVVACYEAYSADIGAAYACSVGCGVSVDMTVNDDEIAQVSVMNNLMDVLFVTRVMDMLSPYDDNPRGNVVEEWGEEVDVYLSEVC